MADATWRRVARPLLGAAALVGICAVLVPWRLLLPISATVVWLLWPALGGRRLLAVASDAAAWTEYWWPGYWRTRRWTALLSVERDGNQARLVTREGVLLIDERLPAHTALLERALAALGESNHPPGATLPPGQVAAWLGLEPDGELVCETGAWRDLDRIVIRRVLPGGAAGLLLLGLILGRSAGWPQAIMPAVMAGVWLTACGALRHRLAKMGVVDEVRARADFLEVRWHYGSSRRFAWSSVRSLEDREGATVIGLGASEIVLSAPLSNLDRFLPALRQAIAAREQGLALPRLPADVPESALSRAAVEVDAERGVSRAAEAGDGSVSGPG